MADRDKKTNTRPVGELRTSAREQIDALAATPAPSPEELRNLYEELASYHDALDQRDMAMQSAVTHLMEDMSEKSRDFTETGTRLETILEAADDIGFIIVSKDEPNNIVEFSRGAERIFGYSRAEAVHNPPHLLCPADADFSEEEKFTCGFGSYAKERVLLQRKSGDIFPAHMSTYPLKDTNDNVMAILTVVIDVTEPEKVQRYLKESNEKHRALVMTVPVSIIAFDKDGIITFVNDWHLNVLHPNNPQPELFIGKKIHELPDVMRAGINAQIKKSLDGHPLSMEDIYIPPFGGREAKWCNIRLAPLVQDEDFTGGILIIEDITRRKLTELDLKLLIDNTPIPLIKAEVTPEGSLIRYLNPEAESMFGKDVINHPVSEYVTHVDHAGTELASMHGDHCEVRARDGVRQAVRTMHEASGQYEIHAIMDVDELIRSKEMAEDASRAKSDFLANISHEIRTPLNVLLGMLQLFQDEDLGDEMNEMAAYATGAANSLLALLNDILDFSVVEARALALDEQIFNLRELIELLVLPYHMEAREKGLTLTHSIDEDVPATLYGDARRLRQILFHVLGNAVKFTDQGSVEMEISYLNNSAKDGRAMVAIMVADTGIGMTEEQIQGIYRPFHQCDGSRTRRHGGTGIGLALVQEFVTAMGGSLWTRSKPGEGSEFVFTVSLGLPDSAKL